ncbi:MAG: glycine/betaine/sarcosine/D-proline family reductase selenoprotein B [Chloroflexota bacterium]|nr:glycine/betaine/sarcosine/D-proline family reductase selenoprotein B [Chloroflexota bacterium]
MPRLDRLSELQRKTSLAHPCLLNDSAPFVLPRRALSESRLALVTTAGIHLRGDTPFVAADQSFRVIPADTPAADIVQSHASIGFDRTAFQRDVNVVFPIDRLREFVQRGEIGSLAGSHYAFMGAQRPPYETLLHDTGPAVARSLRADGVEVVFLTGT